RPPGIRLRGARNQPGCLRDRAHRDRPVAKRTGYAEADRGSHLAWSIASRAGFAKVRGASLEEKSAARRASPRGGPRESPLDRQNVRSRRGPRRPIPRRCCGHVTVSFVLRSVRIAKRAIDVAGGLVGLALSAPLMPIIAAAIYIDSPGPVFF